MLLGTGLNQRTGKEVIKNTGRHGVLEREKPRLSTIMKMGFDDRFSGGLGTKIHADARFYEGLTLSKSFKPFSVYPANDLPATYKNPNLPTNRATPPLVRDWP